ncbi:MAG: ATP-dependent RNA helicase HrpA [Planctomycetota bacterium]
MSLPSPAELAQDRLLRHDYRRLLTSWQRLQRVPEQRRSNDIERWHTSLAAARERFDFRERFALDLQIDPELPIAQHRDAIIDWIQNRQVIVVCGETGSGKSTQLPKLCVAAGLGRYGWIGHTQPRRLAARSIAKRLADETGTALGEGVGYKIRFQDVLKDSTIVKLMTDGVLLAEIHRDRDLEAYDCIIIDEAHERSINVDLLMAYLVPVLQRRPELRLVITSATIDAERFSQHFCDAIGPAPIVMVEGRSYPVEVRYRGAMSTKERENSADGSEQVDAPEFGSSILARFCDAVDELFAEGSGDILAFFPTERDIRDAHKRLRGHLTRRGLSDRTEVLPLYARLTEAEQQRVFQPHAKTRIVLATNVAESSLTVPGIRYVIDTGTARVSRFAAKSRVQRLPIEPICQASANQRSGRCGRLGPGIAIRLYDESDYVARPPFAQPEIRRCDLAATILHTKSLGVDDIESLAWLDPPRGETVREGNQTLAEIGAIDERGELTSVGRQLTRWPVAPRIGRMLLASNENGCLHEMLVIAAALESQDPRVRPVDQAQAADAAHEKFRDPNSDFVSFLKIWDFYHRLREQLGRSRLERALRDQFLSLPRLREWSDVHRQLADQCRDAKWSISSRRFLRTEPNPADQNEQRLPEGYDAIHMAILSGMLSGVAMLDDQGRYRGASNMELQIWPGSGLRSAKPKWMVSGELVETTQRYARTVARIDPRWIERVGAHCVRYSYDSPHFSRNQGSAMVMRRGSLFGLPAVPRIAVPLAPLDPKLARSLLIEHGLAERQLVSRARFWQHNERFLLEIKQVGDRTRRRDCVVDPYALLEFYRNCIPEHVVDRVALEQWDRSLPRATDQPPFLSWEALALPLDRQSIDRDFPDRLELGVTQLPLAYRFEPGDDADGVTVRVPHAAVSQLHREKLEWLVPGLLEEKLTALLKSLPKRLRRQLVPIPDTVRVMLPAMQAAQARREPFWRSVCQWCSEHLGETIRPDDFDLASLPVHLQMRIELIDARGDAELASRDLSAIQQHAAPAKLLELDSKPAATNYAWQRASMQRWDIESLPSMIIETVGGVRVERYPTLQFSDAGISTCVVDDAHLAEQMLRQQWIRLVAMMERRELRSQIAFLPHWNQACLWVSNRWSNTAWTDWVSYLMARLALVEIDWSKSRESFSPCVRTKLDYEAISVRRIEQIGLAAAELGRWIPKFSQAYQQVRKLRESTPAAYASSLNAIDAQISELLDDSHPFHTPWVYLREFPRYLNAMGMRIEKLKAIGASKDQELDRDAAEAWRDYAHRIQALSAKISKPNHAVRWQPSGKLLEYRWMIEELRVSIHAQKLGTRVSVSPKRLERMREQLESGP